MSTAAWILFALGAAGAVYSAFLGLHFYRHRERRKVDRRGTKARQAAASADSDRRLGRDRRRS